MILLEFVLILFAQSELQLLQLSIVTMKIQVLF